MVKNDDVSQIAEGTPRFTMTHRNGLIFHEEDNENPTIDDLVACLRSAADEIQEMKDAGVKVAFYINDLWVLTTENPEVAKRFQMDKEEIDEDDDLD